MLCWLNVARFVLFTLTLREFGLTCWCFDFVVICVFCDCLVCFLWCECLGFGVVCFRIGVWWLLCDLFVLEFWFGCGFYEFWFCLSLMFCLGWLWLVMRGFGVWLGVIWVLTCVFIWCLVNCFCFRFTWFSCGLMLCLNCLRFCFGLLFDFWFCWVLYFGYRLIAFNLCLCLTLMLSLFVVFCFYFCFNV